MLRSCKAVSLFSKVKRDMNRNRLFKSVLFLFAVPVEAAAAALPSGRCRGGVNDEADAKDNDSGCKTEDNDDQAVIGRQNGLGAFCTV